MVRYLNGDSGVVEHAPPIVALHQRYRAMRGLRRRLPAGGPLLLPLVLLALRGSAYEPVSGLRCVGCRVRGPSNVVRISTPWGLSPTFRKRQRGERGRSEESSTSTSTRMTKSGPGPEATMRWSSFPTGRSYLGSSSCGGGGRVSAGITAGFFSHNSNSGEGSGVRDSSSAGFSSELVCDQCGDSYCCDNTPWSPQPPVVDQSKQPPHPQVPSPLAVCRAPGCGVAFSQCQSCEVEYAGCCSVACRTLATQNGSCSAASSGVATMAGGSAERDPRAVQVVSSTNISNGGAKEVPAFEGASGRGDSPDTEILLQYSHAVGETAPVASSSTGASTPLSQTSASRAWPSSSSTGLRQVPGRKRGSQGVEVKSTRVSDSSGGVSNASDGAPVAAHAGGKAKRKRDEPVDEPLLENYASRHSEPESASLAGVREATKRAQPGGAHMVSGHLQGELLKLLTKLSGAKRVLDIGTFTGYSALAFAEALPEDGVVVTLESDARAAETARGHFASSQHGGKIRLLLGQAMDAIDQMIAQEDSAPFDLVFVDADKKKYWDYFEKVLSGPRPLLAPTGMLLADNVLFHELVPLAEATGVAATSPEDASKTTAEGKAQASEGGSPPESPPSGAGDKKAEVAAAAAAAAAVGAGVLTPTPRRMKIAESLDAFNKRVMEDHRVEVLMLPLRDGLSVVRWRSGGYPGGGEP